jgi:hypothetical protein
VEFARKLIARGNKPALKELNRAVGVLGNGVDPNILIRRISDKFVVAKTPEEKAAERRQAAAEVESIVAKLLDTRHVNDAVSMIKKLGGSVRYSEDRGFLLPKVKIDVECLGMARTFTKEYDMVEWVINTIVPRTNCDTP